jgi:hypothetical protein
MPRRPLPRPLLTPVPPQVDSRKYLRDADSLVYVGYNTFPVPTGNVGNRIPGLDAGRRATPQNHRYCRQLWRQGETVSRLAPRRREVVHGDGTRRKSDNPDGRYPDCVAKLSVKFKGSSSPKGLG